MWQVYCKLVFSVPCENNSTDSRGNYNYFFVFFDNKDCIYERQVLLTSFNSGGNKDEGAQEPRQLVEEREMKGGI